MTEMAKETERKRESERRKKIKFELVDSIIGC